MAKVKFTLQFSPGSQVLVEEMPIHVMELIFYISVVTYAFGVPFFTAVNFYFGKLRNVCKTIEELEENVKFSSTFFKECRKLTIISIFVSILVNWLINTLKFNCNYYYYFQELSIFAYLTPQNSDISPFAMFNILESFGIEKPIRNITTVSNKTKLLASHGNLPFIQKALTKWSGFWLQSSIIAVFAVFFVYISIASFIADEFDRQMELEPDLKGDPLILENWWKKLISIAL